VTEKDIILSTISAIHSVEKFENLQADKCKKNTITAQEEKHYWKNVETLSTKIG
jgi:hypothetical protein